jgi:hypothetical protein
MLSGLADALDVAMPDLEELDRTVIAHAARAPQDFTFGDERFASQPAPSGASGSAILSGGGTWQHDPRLAGMRA